MLTIPRSLARQVRAVFRRLIRKAEACHAQVVLRAGDDGLRIRLHCLECWAEYHQAGSLPPEVLILPLVAFARFEGRSDALVSLEHTEQGMIRAQWQDGMVPQLADYEAGDPEKLTPFPDPPEQTLTNEPGVWKALSEASQSAAHDGIRYAVDRIQLRGHTGTIVATDGRQLLLQSGFHFPWTEELLIPSSPVFACPELPANIPVQVGRTPTHISFQAGAWTLLFAIDLQGRYPNAEQVLPSLHSSHTRWRIDPADAAFLAQTLPRLPVRQEDGASVTVDLNGQAVVRAQATGQSRTTELILPRTEVAGPPVRFSINREFLARVLHLGLTDIRVVKPDAPLLAQDERRQLVIMPLGPDLVLPPQENAVRIPSTENEVLTQRTVSERRKPNMKTTGPASSTLNGTDASPPGNPPVAIPESGNGTRPGMPRLVATPPKANGTGLEALLVEAEALKDSLRDAYTRTNQLLLAIKRQKKQAQAVKATLASLRQLQHLDA
jgi:hypothetical protein